MIDSFGIKLTKCKIHVPKLARAIGVHLSTLENAMHDNNPSELVLERLEQVSAADVWHGGPKLKVTQMKWWVEAYYAAKEHERRTVTTREWQVRSPLLECVTHPNLNLSTNMMSWAHGVEAFSWAVVRKMFPWESDEMLALQLESLRFSSHRESVGAKVQPVWRWNPLNLDLEVGRPPKSKLAPPVQQNMQQLFLQELTDKARKILTPSRSCTFDAFCKALHVQPKSSDAMQRIRDVLAGLGWVYDKSNKCWVRTASFIPTIG